MELLKSTKKEIVRITIELENKLDMANNIIKLLNSRTKEQLKDLEVCDRTNIIIDAKRVLTKRRLMQNIEGRMH
jgi:hypothetical protein